MCGVRFFVGFPCQVITIPWYLWLLNNIVNFLPTALADEVSSLMGATHGMTTFKGRGIDWTVRGAGAGGRGRSDSGGPGSPLVAAGGSSTGGMPSPT